MASAEVDHSNASIGTVNESLFSVVAQEVINPDGLCGRTSSEGGIVERQGSHRVESQLSAGNGGIEGAPEAVTDSAPGFIDAKFKTTFKVGGSIDDPQGTILTDH